MLIFGQLSVLIGMVAAGIVLGLIYFSGLWLTVKGVAAKKSMGIRLVGSFIVRLGLVFCAFYLLMDGDWKRLIALMAGFTLARFILIRFIGHKKVQTQEVGSG